MADTVLVATNIYIGIELDEPTLLIDRTSVPQRDVFKVRPRVADGVDNDDGSLAAPVPTSAR